jgi:hypothetical protein
MYPRTAAFDAAMMDSHVMISVCEIRDPSSNNQLLQTFNIVDGDVTVDVSAQASRRTADLNLVDPTGTLIADGLGDLLAPETNEIWLYRGIKYPDGTQEVINLGVFVITDFIMDDSGSGLLIRLSLADRAHTVSAHPTIIDQTFPSGTLYVSAITALIRAAIPTVNINVPLAIPDTMGSVFFETGTDPWKAVNDLSDSIGCEIFFDVYGTCVIRKIPDFTAASPQWTFAEGLNSTVLYFNKQLTSSEFANHVIVLGQSPNGSVPVRAEIADTTSASFTAISGRYGDRSVTIKDSSIKDYGTAIVRAFGELQKRLGFAESVYISCIVFPVFEVYDVVSLVRTRAKINGTYSVAKISIPMTNDRPMYLTFQKRLVT